MSLSSLFAHYGNAYINTGKYFPPWMSFHKPANVIFNIIFPFLPIHAFRRGLYNYALPFSDLRPQSIHCNNVAFQAEEVQKLLDCFFLICFCLYATVQIQEVILMPMHLLHELTGYHQLRLCLVVFPTMDTILFTFPYTVTVRFS